MLLAFMVSSLFKPYGRPMHFGATDIPLVSCAKCGERLLLPETSEYSDAHNVRHRWKCGRCDYLFETTVYLGAQRGRRRSDRQRPLSAPRGSWW
jgi:ribosomal protein S27AE